MKRTLGSILVLALAGVAVYTVWLRPVEVAKPAIPTAPAATPFIQPTGKVAGNVIPLPLRAAHPEGSTAE